MPAKTTPPRRAWTRATVVAAIRSLYQQGSSMTSVWLDDRSLYTAAARLFGSLTTALAILGIQRPSKVKWTQGRVLEAIQARRRQGLPIRNVCVCNAGLVLAARRYFGTWRAAHNAVEATVGSDQ